MKIVLLNKNVIPPRRGSEDAAGYDIYMPHPGIASGTEVKVGLGFATEIPKGYVALLLPRSGAGSKFGIELNNTCGVIDSDYRGEWLASLRTKNGLQYHWKAGERLLQFVLVPTGSFDLEVVDRLDDTQRGDGGFGSTGK